MHDEGPECVHVRADVDFIWDLISSYLKAALHTVYPLTRI